MIALESRPAERSFVPHVVDGQAFKFIGLGGVGGFLARTACLLLGSLNKNVRAVLIDGDSFEPANGSRMFFAEQGNKAAVLRAELLKTLADSRLSLETVEEFVTPRNIQRLIQPSDCILLAVDNHATRRLIDAHCSGDGGRPGLDDICLISGGNDGVGPDSTGRGLRGTYGNAQIYVRAGGIDVTPSLSQLHREIRIPADKLPGDQNCQELIASTPQILPANVQVASAMLSTLWLYLCGEVAYSELAFDIAEGRMRPQLR